MLRGKGKEGGFSEAMVFGNSHILRKFPPNPVRQDAVLKLPRQTLSISRGDRSVGEKVRTAFIITLRLSLYPPVTSCYRHMPGHSPEFQKQTEQAWRPQ